MKIKIRLKVPPYTLVDRHQSSKQPVCLYLQGREIEAEDSLQKVSSFWRSACHHKTEDSHLYINDPSGFINWEGGGLSSRTTISFYP
jgi:hypothetical protein